MNEAEDEEAIAWQSNNNAMSVFCLLNLKKKVYVGKINRQ